jgi:hypothetical protein
VSVLAEFLAAVRRRPLGSTQRQSPTGRSIAPVLPGRPLLALPPPPGADRGPICPACRYRHPPTRTPALTYGTPIDRTGDGRPPPLRQQAADSSSLDRDRFNPWRYP